MIKKFFKFIRLIYRLNLVKTVLINFRMLPLNIAIKFPIFIYGKVVFYSLSGEIEIVSSNITTGMIHIGKDLDHVSVSLLPVKLSIYGKLIFYGSALISGGSTITVWKGLIEIGDRVLIGSGTQIKAVNHIKIDNGTIITSFCILMDTDVHYIIDNNKSVINKNNAKISVGKNCWINSHSTINKGSNLPDNCIVGKNSFFNLNLHSVNDRNKFYVGSPAKLKKSGVMPMFDFEFEKKLNLYFRNEDKSFYQLDDTFKVKETMQGVLDLF